MRAARLAGAATAALSTVLAADAAPLTLSHAWIVVTTGAPERTALERTGFRIAPTINQHDGQGTASVTVELLNGFLELIYPDPSVLVSPALQAGAEKFRLTPVRFAVGGQWLLEVTLDNGTQGVTKDLQPDLPMVVHY